MFRKKYMTFEKAKKKLQKLANGRFNTIQYQYRTAQKECDYNVEVICQLYIDGYSHINGNTWKEAFEKLENTMNPKQVKVNKKEQPDGGPE